MPPKKVGEKTAWIQTLKKSMLLPQFWYGCIENKAFVPTYKVWVRSLDQIWITNVWLIIQVTLTTNNSNNASCFKQRSKEILNRNNDIMFKFSHWIKIEFGGLTFSTFPLIRVSTPKKCLCSHDPRNTTKSYYNLLTYDRPNGMKDIRQGPSRNQILRQQQLQKPESYYRVHSPCKWWYMPRMSEL